MSDATRERIAELHALVTAAVGHGETLVPILQGEKDDTLLGLIPALSTPSPLHSARFEGIRMVCQAILQDRMTKSSIGAMKTLEDAARGFAIVAIILTGLQLVVAIGEVLQ